MATKTPVVQVCRNCREKNPKKAKYCMNCGKPTQIRSTRYWKWRKLSISKNFSVQSVVNILRTNPAVRVQFETDAVTRKDILEALWEMTEKRRQMSIRLLGIGGTKPQTPEQIAQETGLGKYGVKTMGDICLRDLALGLRTRKPDANQRHLQKEFERSIREIGETVRRHA